MNKLRGMTLFVAVVEHGSFSRAAHALHVGVASVSDYVAALEQEVGARLLDRTTRGLAPTPQGAVYYEMCQRVLSEIALTERQIIYGEQTISGPVRVQLPEHVLRHFVLPVLKRFHTKYPEVTLHFNSDDTFQPTRALVDITIRSALPFEATPRGALPLGHTRTVLVASPAYLDNVGRPTNPSHLVDHQCLGFVDPVSGRTWEWYFSEKGQTFEFKPACWLTTNRGGVLSEMALLGLGIAMELECNVREHVRSGRLEIVLSKWSREQAIGSVFYDKSRKLSAQAKTFLDFLL